MLFIQLAGWESQGDSPFMLVLFALRCIVSLGYIYLCRTKNIRFTSVHSENVQEHPPTQHAEDPAFTLDDVRLVVIEVMAQMKVSDAEKLECREQLQLPEHTESTKDKQKDSDSEEETESGKLPKNFYRVQAFLADAPDATIRDVALALEISLTTANKRMHRVR